MKKKKVYKLIPFEQVLKETFTPQEIREMEARTAARIALLELKEARKKLSITQEELSKKSGVARDVISNIENGKQNFTIETLYKVAFALNKKVTVTIE